MEGALTRVDRFRLVGTDVPRVGVDRFVKGQARYVANLDFPSNGLHACFVRSRIAHGRIRSVDTGVALFPAGPARAALTGEDVRATSLPMAGVWAIEGHAHPTFWSLAVDKVRYVGDPIAIVAAEDPYAAQRAAELVRIEIDPLLSYLDASTALAASPSELLFDELDSNILYESFGRMADRSEESAYPIEHTEAGPDAVQASEPLPPGSRLLKRSFRTGRVSGVSMEPRGCIAEWDGTTLRFTTSTQVPSMVRRILADVLQLRESAIEVVTPDVGGGFGIKIGPCREEVAVALLAMSTGLPVRWIETTVEYLQNAPHGRDERVDVSVGYEDDGRITGIHVETLSDAGAYSVTPVSSALEAAAMPLRLPHLYSVGELSYATRAVMTNKPSLGTYRGVAAPVGAFVLHRVMQEIAHELGRDISAIARANLLAEGVQQRTPAGMNFDPGQYERALDEFLEAIDYEGVRAEQLRRRLDGDAIAIGVSVIGAVEPSAVSMDGLGIRVVSDWEEAFVRVNPDCTVEVRLAAGSSGQPHETTFAVLAAEVLGVDPQSVLVTVDTSRGVYGSGSWGSRISVVSGGAVVNAAAAVAAKIRAIAAGVLDVPVDSTELTAAGTVCATDGREVLLQEICEIAYFSPRRLPPGVTPGLAAFESYALHPITTSPYAWHGCVVEIDTRTAGLKLRKYVVVSDSGTVITPALLEEQIRGGIAQGIGQALFETIEYDDNGVALQGDLFGYRVPRAADLPEEWEIRHIETPSPLNVFGIKGGGESGAIGAPAAVALAVTDALWETGFRVDELPIKHFDLVRATTGFRGDPSRLGVRSATGVRLRESRQRRRGVSRCRGGTGNVPGRRAGASLRDVSRRSAAGTGD